MALALLSHTAQKPPNGPLKLDLGNELAQGLIFATVLNEYGSRQLNNQVNQGVRGSLAGTATWGSGLRGSALSLPGTVGNFADYSNYPAINGIGASPFSVFALVRRDTAGANQMAVTKSSGASANGWWLGWPLTNQIEFASKLVTTTADAVSAANYAATGEHSLLGTLSATLQPRLYVRGAEVAYATQNTGSGAVKSEGTASLALGQLTDGFWPFPGLIYCAYIWNRTLNPSDAAALDAEPYAMFQTRPLQRWFVITVPDQPVTVLGTDPLETMGTQQVLRMQALAPASDVSTGGWVTETGSTTNLYQSIDELAASNADYIQSPGQPVPSITEVALSTGLSPDAGPRTLSYRYGKDLPGGQQVDLQVDLLESGIVVQTWTHTDIPSGFTEVAQNVTATITNYGALSVRLTSTQA